MEEIQGSLKRVSAGSQGVEEPGETIEGDQTNLRSPSPLPLLVASDQFFVKDTKSSSGTFLNHIRLSPPSVESKPFAIKVRLLSPDFLVSTTRGRSAFDVLLTLSSFLLL